MRAPLRKAMLWAGAASFGAVLMVPRLIWNEGPRSASCYSFEYGFALLAVAVAARTRAHRAARHLIVALYSVLLLFLFYEYAFKASFQREPALIEDYRLAINLFHFLSEMTSARWLVFMGCIVAGAVALVVTLNRVLAALQQEFRSTKPAYLAVAAAAWTALGGISVLAGGPVRVAAAKVVDNCRASMQVRERLEVLGDTARDDRNRDLLKVRLARKPNFYFLVVEAYGEVLATWDMTDAYRALTARVQTHLQGAGYHMRSSYSAAPVHGGRSWLSLATMQTGILIDQPESFKALEAASPNVPTLIGFFRNQGYHTASLEPGTRERSGVGSGDIYDHELRLDAPRLGYTGRSWGFGTIPDQFTLDTFRFRHLGTLAEPRYLFYMAVSTHYPWNAETVPSFEGGGDWPPLSGTESIGSDFRRYYLKSVEYEWRTLTAFLEADRSQDIVIIVIGDHQPRLESNPPGEVTFRTPIHVISRDRAFVERLEAYGFQPGLYADPTKAPPLVHEALFSLFVSELAGAYGTPDTQGFARYFPGGISLRGLNP